MLLGVVAEGADLFVRPGPLWEPAIAVSLATNAVCVWAGLAVFAGWVLRHPLPAALAGVLSQLVAVASYYGFALVFANRRGSSQILSDMEHWLLVAVVVGPLLGLMGSGLRRADWLGLINAVLLPVGALVDVLRFQHPAKFEVMPWSAAVQVLLVVLAAVLGAAAHRAARRKLVQPGLPVFAHSEVKAVPEHVGWEQG